MHRIITSLLIAFTPALLSAQALTSPNGRLTANISQDGPRVSYSVSLDGEPLLSNAQAALTFAGKAETAKLRLLTSGSKTETIQAFAYRQSEFSVSYNVQTYRLTPSLNIEFRAYDDGICYRFVQTAKGARHVSDELATFHPTGDPLTYAAYSTNEQKPEAMAFQNIYTADSLSRQPQGHWAFMPVVLDFGKAKLTLLEADLEAYPGMFLATDNGSLQARFAHYPRRMDYYRWRGMSYVAETEDYIAQTSGRRSFPWRIISVTTDDRQMPVSNLVYALAAPNCIGDTSWIRTGKSAWDWWHDWNLKGVPFQAGINMDTYRYYIDFAARYGLEYVILDEGWYDSNKAELMQSIPEIDVPELVNYAAAKGVGIVLWTVFNVLDEHLEEACAKYAAMGVKGFKVDFLDRDDQTAVEMAYRIAEVCARHHLVLDYHGFYKPTGLNRTYPNVINFESVFGMEEMKWNEDGKDMPLYDVTFPYIRMMAGPVDYTPGAMRNATRKDFRAVYDRPMSMGTRAHQAATYVVHDSPFTMLADAATSYEAEPAYTAFIASLPNRYDETRILLGELGKYIVTARRAGSDWYVAGMTNWDARELDLPLGFLDGQAYEFTLLADGPNAGKNAEDYCISQPAPIPTGVGQHIGIKMAGGGGFVMKLTLKQ